MPKETTLQSCLMNFKITNYEGKVSLIEEFGKNYSVYFAILQLVASGKSKHSELLASLPDIKNLLSRFLSGDAYPVPGVR